MIGLLFLLIVLGVVLYVIERFLPMAPAFRIAIRLIVVLIVLAYLFQLIGWLPALPPLGR